MARSSTSTTSTDPVVVPDVVPTPETDNPKPQSDHGSAEADGVRTEAEVVTDEQAALAGAATAAGAPGTGSPALIGERPVLDTDPDDDAKVLRYERTDGAVFEANEGTAAHRRMARDPAFKATRKRA